MTVEDVLRIVGAKGVAPSAPGAAPEPPAPTADRPVVDAEQTDWRATLRAAGGAPAEDRKPVMPATPPPRPAEADRQSDAAAEASPRSRAEDAAIARPRPEEARGAAGMEETPLPTPEREPARGAGSRDWTIPGVDAPVGIVVGRSTSELFAGPVSELESLAAVAETVARCTRCTLYSTARNPVPGTGRPDADLMCVGEAPGENEDEQGKPFVGVSGQLLTKILAAIGLARDEVFIANVIKHRPPANRNPRPEEVEACSPYLVRQVELVKPKVIIAFGTFAAQTLLETKTPIGKLRGAVHRYHGIPLIVTYHPAALLRNEAWKRPTWEDVKLARRILDSAAGA
jgi:uracil-DNA glycosylase family 4